jgi:hypothetical protein
VIKSNPVDVLNISSSHPFSIELQSRALLDVIFEWYGRVSATKIGRHRIFIMQVRGRWIEQKLISLLMFFKWNLFCKINLI